MEVAERAGLADRTYADIERGSVNMRIETVLHICETLYITPDEIFTNTPSPLSIRQDELFDRLNACTPREKETALRLLETYLQSLI